MSTYLLLRNNKESGPFSLQQMQQMGLKPYDLIWVEGKSAAWRYAGEVNELKGFAPATEEQPFDRFYKKDPEKKEKHFYEEIEEKESKLVKEKPVPVKTDSKIFVSMPQRAAKLSAPVSEIKTAAPPLPQKEYSETNYAEPGLIENYSQSLEEIKKQYAETYLNRKRKIHRKENFKKVIPISAVFAFVLILGYLIYINFSSDETKTAASKTIVGSVPKIIDKPVENKTTVLVPKENPAILSIEKSQQGTDIKSSSKETEVKNQITSTENKQIGKKEPATNENAINNQPMESDAGNRSKKTREEHETIAEKPVDISSQVTVKANDYKIRTFGGVENLQLTVNNDSKYMLDKVMVEVQYLKPSEQPLKKENIQFDAIAPNTSMTIKVPNSSRGIKVIYKITEIKSAQLDKSTAGL